MDSTLKLVQMAKAREDQIAALENSGAAKSDMDELRSIRDNGLYRDSYDVEEAKKIAEILGKLFPDSAQASSDSGESLEDKTVVELKEMAKAQDVPEYYKLNRQELLEELS